MKILVNVWHKQVPHLAEWQECEAFRLVEQADGSFELEVTKDLKAAREVERIAWAVENVEVERLA